jgi:hypothetical protein
VTRWKFLSVFLKDGRLTGLGILFLLIFGICVTYVCLTLLPGKVPKLIGLSVGLAIMGIAGFSARASALGLPPPFTNDPLGWRAAKKSYTQDPDQPAQDTDKSDIPKG